MTSQGVAAAAREATVKKLAFFDETANKYVVDAGRYGLQVGSSSADIKLTASVRISGTIRQRPTVVNAKPIQAGDREKQIQQRVFFDVNTTIAPQLTVSMTDESLYGYVTKGQSRPLPAGLSVEYTSNRPKVVRVTGNGTISGPANQQCVSVVAGSSGGSYTVSLTVGNGSLQVVCSHGVIVNPLRG